MKKKKKGWIEMNIKCLQTAAMQGIECRVGFVERFDEWEDGVWCGIAHEAEIGSEQQ